MERASGACAVGSVLAAFLTRQQTGRWIDRKGRERWQRDTWRNSRAEGGEQVYISVCPSGRPASPRVPLFPGRKVLPSRGLAESQEAVTTPVLNCLGRVVAGSLWDEATAF